MSDSYTDFFDAFEETMQRLSEISKDPSTALEAQFRMDTREAFENTLTYAQRFAEDNIHVRPTTPQRDQGQPEAAATAEEDQTSNSPGNDLDTKLSDSESDRD